MLSSQMTKTFRDKSNINMKQWTSCEILFPDVRTQWKMYSFVPSVSPCMHHNYLCDFRKAYILWLRAAYNFGCRALYNLPWRASVSSYQVQCNIPTFETLLKKCVSVSRTMQRVQQCMVARFAAVRFFIPVLVLIIWTLQPYVTLWLSARTLQC